MLERNYVVDFVNGQCESLGNTAIFAAPASTCSHKRTQPWINVRHCPRQLKASYGQPPSPSELSARDIHISPTLPHPEGLGHHCGSSQSSGTLAPQDWQMGEDSGSLQAKVIPQAVPARRPRHRSLFDRLHSVRAGRVQGFAEAHPDECGVPMPDRQAS